MSVTCFFIGHRDVPESIYPTLIASIERHIVQYGVEDFLVGRYGAFDRMAARAVRQVRRDHPGIRLTLLLAYYSGNAERDVPEGFDGSLYPSGIERVPKRAAIVYANMRALQLSRYLIAYNQNHIGNTRNIIACANRLAAKGLMAIDNFASQ